MAEATFERTVGFQARHHYRRADRTEAEDRAAFGPVADPHAHDYVVTVSVRGVPDRFGFLTDLTVLDRALAEVVGPLRGGDLNALAFGDGVLQPTTEALARWLFERLRDRIPGPGRLVRVKVMESPTLGATWEE